jgi:hypothetical protein
LESFILKEGKMKKLYLIAIAILITMSFIVVPTMAKTPDGNTPAEETVCDEAGLFGAAWGLCNAYCEAMDCDSSNPNASDNACDKLFDKIVRLTGDVPLCEVIDLCPDDPDKTDPGQCGCGIPDTDSDGDGVADCRDLCPLDPDKTEPGDCNCGIPDTDSDGDGTADCIDGCDDDPDKTDPGICGCGRADTDSDGDGIPDCIDPYF